MSKIKKTRVFMSGRSQAVRRDPESRDLILSQPPVGWDEVYDALDKAGVPDDFLADRAQGLPQTREGW